jgi:hypothetical protein
MVALTFCPLFIEPSPDFLNVKHLPFGFHISEQCATYPEAAARRARLLDPITHCFDALCFSITNQAIHNSNPSFTTLEL